MSGRHDFDRLEAALKQFNENLDALRALADAPVAMGSRETQEGGESQETAHKAKSLTVGGGSTEQGGPAPSLIPEEA